MKRTKLPPHKKGAWFVPVRGSYLPISWQGWLSYIPFIGYLLFSLQVAHDISNSLVPALFIVVPNWVAAMLAITWLARQKS